MSVLQARKVDIDFADAKVHWNPAEPEYSQFLNAVSSLLADLEPFLIKTVREAKAALPEAEVSLAEDCDLFMKQEGRHFRLHRQFNEVMRANGYELDDAEARIRKDFERFLADKSPRFRLAYSEGFETFGPVMSSFFFDKAPELMADWDEPTVYLWLWHFAEEFEHRSVCNHLYERLYGSYWARIHGLWFAIFHLFGHVLKLASGLMATDRSTGRIVGRFRSRLRYVRVLGRLAAFMFPRVVFRCMRPSYDPQSLKWPTNVERFLADASQRYGVIGETPA